MGGSAEFGNYFNLEEIQYLQDSFADAHQVGSVITRPDGSPITHPANFSAHDSDIPGKAKPEQLGSFIFGTESGDNAGKFHTGENITFQPGLMHAFASVTCGGEHIANWHIWKARDENPEVEIPDLSQVQFRKIVKMLDILAREVSEKATLKMQVKLHHEIPENFLTIELEKKRLLDEKIRADKILSEQSSILRNILDNSPVGIWMMDETGRMKFVNKTYCDAIGIPERDFLAVNHYSVLYDEATAKRCIDSDKTALETNVPCTSHETVMFTDEQYHDLEIVKNKIRDANGNTLGLIGISLDITEQKRAKEELLERKEKYRGLSEASFEAIFFSEKGICVEQNQTAEKMFGYPSSEAIGRYGTEWIVPEDRDLVMQNMLKGTEEPYEAIALRKDGTTFPCMLRGKMMNYKGKNVRVTSLNDITEFKRAQNALRESELRYRSLFQNTPSGIMLLDEYGIILEANEAIAKTTGYSYNELVGSDVRMLTAFENRYMVAENIQRIIFGQKLEQEVKSKRKDGTFRTLLLREVAILLPNGKTGVLSVSNDISDRKKAEAALEESEVRYRLIAENTADMIVVYDMNLNAIFVSPSVKTLFGYTSQDLISSGIKLIISPNSMELVQQVFEEEMALEKSGKSPKERSRIIVTENYHKNGTAIWFESKLSFIRDESGQAINILAISRDITERLRVENEIIKLNQELDQRVRQRTAELEAANKELESFSYSVSHDLKAPLRHISGFIHLLLENKSTEFSDTDLEYIHFISNSANEMGRLIDAILSFSRLNSSALHLSTIHSASLVKEVIHFFKPEIQNRTIEFIVESLPDIQGDIALIRQVWTNLISNAIKYTGKKSEALIVIGSRQEDDMVTFFIRDNGAGFKMAKAGKLFGVFQRLHKTSDFEGVGIGLANVNRIIMRHGGHCRAYPPYQPHLFQ